VVLQIQKDRKKEMPLEMAQEEAAEAGAPEKEKDI